MSFAIPSTWFYNIAILGYVSSLFAYVFNLGLRRALLRRLATIGVGVGFILQTSGMVLRWIEAGFVEVAAVERGLGVTLSGLSYFVVFTQHPPWSNLYEILVYMSWGIVLVFLVSEVKWRIRFLGIFALVLTLTTLGMASLTDGNIKPLVPALKSWWIMIHVISASIAYAAGTIAAICSLLYLVKAQERVRLSHICGGVMALSALMLMILGRGFHLLLTGAYQVKLLKVIDGQEMVVGRVQEGQFAPFFVSSPYAGGFLLLAIVACVLSAVWMFRSRHDQPTSAQKASYVFAVLASMVTLYVILWNDLRGLEITSVGPMSSMLTPPGPWQLGLRSNTWDLALFAIVLLGQMSLLVVILWPKAIRKMLAEASKLDRVAYANVMVAFSLMAVVLVTGALWAHYAWGRYWGWDPKETGALVIWLTYALYLHTRVSYGWVGPRSAVIGVLAFFVILAGFLGVNLGWCASGLHSYGSA